MKHFPTYLADNLARLTYLSLRSNRFTQVPAAVTQITTLKAVDLSRNKDLQLRDVIIDTLSTMPHLRGLCVKKCRLSKLSESSRAIVDRMSKQFD